MEIRCKISTMSDSDSRWHYVDLTEFFLQLPNISIFLLKANLFPPVQVLNDFLSIGSIDLGMGGYFEWEPVNLEKLEYDDLVLGLETNLNTKINIEVSLENAQTYAIWYSLAIGFLKGSTKRV